MTPATNFSRIDETVRKQLQEVSILILLSARLVHVFMRRYLRLKRRFRFQLNDFIIDIERLFGSIRGGFVRKPLDLDAKNEVFMAKQHRHAVQHQNEIIPLYI